MAIDPQLAKLLGSMRDSIKPPEGSLPAVQPARVDPDIGLNGPLPTMSGDDGGSAQPLPDRTTLPDTPVRIGVSSRGLSGIDKSLANLAAQREAATQFPSSKVTGEGDILPPKMHHGLKDRLKSIGATALLGMGDIARSNPNASAAQILAGGAAGGITGGVSPVTGDAMLARERLQRSEGDVGRELDLAKDAGQVSAINAEPALKAERIRVDQEIGDAKAREAGVAESGRNTRAEAQRQVELQKAAQDERHQREMERQGQDSNDIRRIPKPTTGTPPEVIKRNIATIREQQSKIDKFLGNPKNQTVTQPSGEPYIDPVTKKTVIPTKTVVNPEWETAKADRNRLDAEIRDWEGKRRTVTTSGNGRTSPSTHVFSVAAWLKANPGKTEVDAKTFHDSSSKYKGYEIGP